MLARMDLGENVPLAAHTTLGLGGLARYWAEISGEAEIPDALAWAEAHHLAVLVLGSGSNVLAADAGFVGLALHLASRGVQATADGCVTAAAGENWDGFVASCVSRGWAGIECLSGIPGTVGATPVQNVGAYGQDVAETIVRVRAWDRRDRAWVELTGAECGFAYRTSRFNTCDRERFLITSVTLQLCPGGAATLRYPELRKHIAEGASLAAVREAVLALRRGKAMVLDAGEADCRSAGSFFKNPVVEASAAPAGAPQYPAANGRVKIPAAWLIEHAGIAKGFQLSGSGVRVSSKHVLALVNEGAGTAAQLLALAEHIRSAVLARWHIRLEMEPVLVGF